MTLRSAPWANSWTDQSPPHRVDCQIRLKDGRQLGYTEYGDPQGKPLIYCHGFPACRLEAQLFDAAASRCKVRIIAVDRPGYGLSDFKPNRTIVEWPDDIAELSDELGLQRFAVLGLSGGGPYALACAWKIPSRLTAVGVIGGLGPVYESWAIREMKWIARLGFNLAQRASWLLPWVYGGVTARIMRWRPEILQSLLSASSPTVDQILLQRPEIKQPLLASIQGALRNGPQGVLHELVLYAHFWGFRLEDIPIAVYFWQGEIDATVPPSHARRQIQALAHVHARFFPDEGHLSLPINHIDTILCTLMGLQ